MAIPILMPRQGQSVETCIITEWVKKKGDKVEKGDILFAYETDKASFEVEAEADGILLELFYNAGDEVPVLTNVAVIGQPGESIAAFVPENVRIETAEISQTEPAEIVTDPLAKETDESASAKIRISPRARKLAKMSNITLETLIGTGPNGRIIVRDVENAIQNKQTEPTVRQPAKQDKSMIRSTAAGEGAQMRTDNSKAPNNLAYTTDFEVRKLSNIRKIIAKNMSLSLQNSAQLTHHLSADVRKLLAFRQQIKEKSANDKSVPNITLHDMICYCLIKALQKHRDINSHYSDEGLRIFTKIHLGFAVDTPRGLMVPVVRNADDLSLAGLSSQMKSLAEQCKAGSINPELLASEAASFTVSNLGNYGVEMFTPVLNLPQVGILGVCTIIYRPCDLGAGIFGFAPHIGLSLTYDHRAIDGAPATIFLAEIKKEIEKFDISII